MSQQNLFSNRKQICEVLSKPASLQAWIRKDHRTWSYILQYVHEENSTPDQKGGNKPLVYN